MTPKMWMHRALELAESALGRTAPNPPVGAVIVRDGVFVSEGHTQPVGGAHAEIVAIRSAKKAKRDVAGCEMYVTLEPCCHVGRTPPCTNAIIESGIKKVIIGTVDPYKAMRGRGIRQLREAGVDVEVGVEQDKALRVIRGFHRACLHGLPEVTCKTAISLDGAIATAEGESQWITGPEARQYGHQLRATHDAILVGVGTVVADNPRLNCRALGGKDPIPVVLDTKLRISESAALFSAGTRPILFCGEDAPYRELDADVVRVPLNDGGTLDITRVLRHLAARGVHRVLVEGGAEVHRTCIDANLVDTLYVFVAGTVIPGGRRWLAGPALQHLEKAPRFGPPKVMTVGDDVMLQYDLVHQFPMRAMDEEE